MSKLEGTLSLENHLCVMGAFMVENGISELDLWAYYRVVFQNFLCPVYIKALFH